MNLTQSAISRQIKTLEERLGVELFQRGHRTLSLTDAGAQFYATSRDVLGQLRDVAARLRSVPALRQVTVTTVPGFASLWLIPRLASFAAMAPSVDVRISVSLAVVDLDREQVDIAIRYCTPAAGTGTVLFEEQFLPVCAPQLLGDADAPLATVQDLRHHALLDLAGPGTDGALMDWKLWLRSVNASDVSPLRVLSFSQYDSVVAAAVAGQGVAIGRLPLIAQYLVDGRLRAPFAGAQSSTKAYCLVSSSTTPHNPAATMFIQWLLDETGREAQARSGTGPR